MGAGSLATSAGNLGTSRARGEWGGQGGQPKKLFPINAGEAKPKLKSKRAGGIGMLLMAGSEQCYFPSQGELWQAPLRDGSSMQQMQGRSVCQEPVS